MILIQISLYPLAQQDISQPLNEFWDILKKNNINFKICPLSTIVWHEDEDWLNEKIFSAYKSIRKNYKVVMVTTVTTGSREEMANLVAFIH
jgi:uncharacterized protein YqgV (UPF0045/DUF77 family)